MNIIVLFFVFSATILSAQNRMPTLMLIVKDSTETNTISIYAESERQVGQELINMIESFRKCIKDSLFSKILLDNNIKYIRDGKTFGYINSEACYMCGQPIKFNGKYWEHIGDFNPRHPAIKK